MKILQLSIREILANRHFIGTNNLFQKNDKTGKFDAIEREDQEDEEETVVRSPFFVPEELLVKHQGQPVCFPY
jgi:hypothetical protein